MSKILLPVLFLTILPFISFGQFAQENITLLSNWFDSTLLPEPNLGANYNSVWGYADNSGKEYAILGANAGTYIVEVTNPANPVLRDFVPGRRDECIWREYKTFGHYLYMVSDDSEPNSFQIADLSYLPDSVHIVYDSDTLFARSHTVFIDGNKLYCGSVTALLGSAYYSMAVYNLVNPSQPQLLRTLNDDYPAITQVHDMFVRNDTIYASCGNQGLYVFKLNSNNTFTMLGSVTSYPDLGYNHSSWLTTDGKTMVFTDEVPADLAVKVIDVSDLSDITVKSVFKSNIGATPHNPYVVGNSRVVLSYYKDGVQIYNISDPSNPVRTGYFDTYPQNGTDYTMGSAYEGCWGAYPFLPSGVVLASDMQNGLFVLNANEALGVGVEENHTKNITVYPTVFSDNISMEIPGNSNQKLDVELFDLTGHKLWKESVEGSDKIVKDFSFLSPGVYFIRFNGVKTSLVQKVIRKN